ncbi:hypothetical protein [Treponema sp.]|uniref:hypothetical protein n=1 Tax=Treponema sp. TaxID=166 RepID=UPI00388F0B0D
MKKLILLLCLSIFSLAFAQDENSVPELLKGVWKNSSRYIVFDSGYSNENGSIPMMVLRAFYQRYDDRTAEPNAYTEKNERPLNDVTQKDLPEEISVKFIQLTPELVSDKVVLQEDGDEMSADGIPSGAWNMQVKYPRRKEIYNIPFAVIGNKLYLDFIVKQEDSDNIPKSAFLDGNVMQSGNPLNGYWQDSGNASGILVSPPVSSKELMSFYINENSVYHIRYWRTDMDYDGEKQAVFSDGEETFRVPKHLSVGGQTFTCVNGRGTRIRNIEKSEGLSSEHTLNSILVKKHGTDENGNDFSYSVRTSTICAMGKPYLELVEGKTIEQIIKEDSEKKYPAPKPLFPPHGILDFDWSIIEDPPANWNMRMLDLGK